VQVDADVRTRLWFGGPRVDVLSGERALFDAKVRRISFSHEIADALELLTYPASMTKQRTSTGTANVDMSVVAQRLLLIARLLEATNELLRDIAGRLPSFAATETPSTIPRRKRGRPPKVSAQTVGRRSTRWPQRASTAATKILPLHQAITAVLEEAGEPLSAKEISDRIRERGLFRPPRSGQDLSASVVNSRVSNPHYRERYQRQDGRIGLADIAAS
jgi:hypothetical protein